MIDIRCVLVRYPERAVRSEDESFVVDGDTFAAEAGLTETIAGESCDGKDGKSG